MITLNQAIKNYNRKTKKKPLELYRESILSPTGFFYLDAANGVYHVTYDEDGLPVSYFHNVGVVNGGVNAWIGKSGTGKTSLVFKVALAQILPYYNKSLRNAYIGDHTTEDIFCPIQILDSEETFTYSNAKRISQLPKNMLDDILTINPVSVMDDIVLAIEKHVEYKINNMKKIPMPLPDVNGEPIYQYPPSVIITDSISTIKDVEAETLKDFDKLSNNTAGARMAKGISALVSLMTSLGKKYNITFHNINHINKAPNMSGFAQAKQYKGLKPEETVKGGERQLYLCTNIWRLDHKKIIADTNAVNKINLGKEAGGNVISCKIIKSKTNTFGGESTLVMLDDCGHDQLVSTVIDAMDREHIRRKGNFWYLEDYPNDPIPKRLNGIRKFFEDPAKCEALYKQLMPHWEKLMSKDADLDHIKRINEKMEDMALTATSDSEFESMFNEAV